jgi:glycerol uptake facilitator-like aquaporin
MLQQTADLAWQEAWGMPFDVSVLVPVIIGVLGCNVLCLLVMLLPRSGRRRLIGGGAGLLAPCRACLAEAIGTFAVVFVASLTALTQTDPVGSALAQGLIVAGMIAALGRFSGGHYNPAVTLGVVASGRLHPVLGTAYWLAQFSGAVAAAVLFAGLGWIAVTPEVHLEMVTVPAGVMVEAVATFFLVLVVFGSTLDERAPRVVHPLAVGLTVTVGVLALGPLTGGALNPARFAGPALVAQKWTHWVVYIAGPCLGGSLAAVLMQFFFLDSPAAELERELGLNEPAPGDERRAA